MAKIGYLWGKLLLCSFILFSSTPSQAQITPDNTLGNDSSRLTPNSLIKGANGDLINGGAIRGSNLFHSFTQFNIGDGQRVYFANPSGVQNILTRVTGGNASQILGTLGVDGVANLFLMNPNGILFGKNASLDVRGSFVGTTANAIEFGGQGLFSATNPEAPPLLTINPSAMVFTQQSIGAIANQSQAPAGINPNGDATTGLRVDDGKSLLLVGGDINLNGGRLRAYGGKVELAGLGTPGSVGLNIAGDSFSLNIPNNVALADISLKNEAAISTIGAGGGNILINAKNLDFNNSYLYAGIAKNVGNGNNQAGNINLNVTGAITLSQGSGIFNNVDINGKGNAGDININTGSLSLFNGSEINTKTYGQGNAGNINIIARDNISADGFENITLSDGSQGLLYSRIISAINPEGVGRTGDIQIKTGSLQLSNGAFISSSTLGKGDAGNLTIDANDITFNSDGYITSSVYNLASGKGGDIRVNTENLSLFSGSQISTTTSGKGDAGNIFINVRNSLKLDGIANNSTSGIQSGVITGGIGNGGNIEVNTPTLSVINGAQIDTDTDGKGNAGNITINARNINVEGSGKLSTEKFGEISLPSGISSDLSFNGVGRGGDIRIVTNELSLKNSGSISSNTFGQGNAGNIYIQASDTISLRNSNQKEFTQIDSTVSRQAKGNGGNINIEAGNLSLDNAFINGYTFGQGNASNISIKVQNTLSLDNTSALTNSVGAKEAIGNGGNMNIQAKTISINNGSSLFASSAGQGNGGNIFVQATDSFSLTNDSFISSSIGASAIGNAGNINILTGSFRLNGESSIFNSNLGGKGSAGNIIINSQNDVSFQNGSFLSSSTQGEGSAGNINILAGGNVTISGRSDRLSGGILSGVLPEGVGKGGDINIQAQNFFLSDNASLNALSDGKGNSGNVFINTLGNTTIKDSSIAAFANQQGSAGKIVIRAGGDVFISGNSYLTSALGKNAVGSGGDIDIQARNFSLTDGAKFFSTTVGKGDAGNILVNVTGDVKVTNGSQLRADTFGQGNAGNVSVNAGGNISLDGIGSGQSNSGVYTIVGQEAGLVGQGKGGNINVTARNLSLTNGAYLSSSSIGDGNAGNINVNTRAVKLDNQSGIAAITNSGSGGNINLNATDFLLLRRNSGISTTGGFDNQSAGDGGNIFINTPFIIAVSSENSDISANAFSGNGGTVKITTQNLFGIAARPIPTPESDITASSQSGVQGEISITQPNVQTTQAIIELPEQFSDATNKIAQTCPNPAIASRPLGKFVISGRGNLPPNPLEPLAGKTINASLATLESDGTSNISNITPSPSKEQKTSEELVEAQGWVIARDGSVSLVTASNQSPTSTLTTATSCPPTNQISS